MSCALPFILLAFQIEQRVFCVIDRHGRFCKSSECADVPIFITAGLLLLYLPHLGLHHVYYVLA